MCQWFFAVIVGKASQCTGLCNLKPSDAKCRRDCFIIKCSLEKASKLVRLLILVRS